MIKKLMSLIFEDETIEEEQPKEAEPMPEPKQEKPLVKSEVRILDEAKTKPEPVKEAPVQKKEAGMLGKVNAEPAATVTKSKKPAVSNKIEYEFSPVISPIYGITDERKVQVASNSQKKTYTSSNSPTGIVLSPINGNIKEEKQMNIQIDAKDSTADKEAVAEEDIVDISLVNILDHVTPYGTSKETMPASETKETQMDKKVLLSKNLSLFDDEE